MVFNIDNKIIQCFLSSADYVFFENSSSNPYLIRRIEELNKVHFPQGREGEVRVGGHWVYWLGLDKTLSWHRHKKFSHLAQSQITCISVRFSRRSVISPTLVCCETVSVCEITKQQTAFWGPLEKEAVVWSWHLLFFVRCLYYDKTSFSSLIIKCWGILSTPGLA